MTINGNNQAFPIPMGSISDGDYIVGITKRELFAAMAMQGLCANPSRVGKFDGYAVDALRLADALLAALATPAEEK